MITLKEMTECVIASGMTEPELARVAKTTQATINRIRRGKTLNPAYDTGRAIELAYVEIGLAPVA